MQTIDRSRPVARKPHWCSMCGRIVEPGEQYCRSFNVDGGDAWTWKECEHCEAMIAILWKYFEGYAYDQGYGPDAMGEFEPTTLTDARLKIYWQHGWRRPDGSLYPIPAEQLAA